MRQLWRGMRVKACASALKKMIIPLIQNRYEIIAPVGPGSLGTVYRARDIESGQTVAVKILEKEQADTKRFQRFMQGLDAVRSLNHPNIVKILDSGILDESMPYYVCEFLEGRSLHDEIKRRGALDLERAITIAEMVCEAIEYAHYHGIVHRTLKPANIMLIKNNGGAECAKVMDFALAKSYVYDPNRLRLTGHGEFLGLPEYMSPEQCQSKDTDWRADIYSLGCILFCMLSGVPPIKGANFLDTIMKQAKAPPIRFEDANPTVVVPHDVQAVIYRALEKDPANRQQTAMQLKQELIEALVVAASNPSQPALCAAAPQVSAAAPETSESLYKAGLAFEKGENGKVDFDAALVAYRKAADLGCRDAQFALGSLMERAKSTQNIAEIATWFRKAADQGHAEAEFRTAQAYEIGLGVKRSIVDAIDWYERSISHGKTDANSRLPALWFEAANAEAEPNNKTRLLKKAAEGGHFPAQVAYALRLANQSNADSAETLKWMKAAAEAGDTECQVKLALAYKNGSLSKANLGETENWLRIAAEKRFRYASQPAFADASPAFDQIIEFSFSLANRGHSEAMYWLGICYNDGLGVPVDPKQAAKWFHKASQLGYGKADEELANTPAHVVETVAKGRPKWDHRSTVLPFNLSEENRKLIDTCKTLSTKESFAARIDLYECFLNSRLLVPFTDDTSDQFHYISTGDGTKAAIAFSDFGTMTEWRSAISGGGAWLEKDAFECCSMLVKSATPMMVLNPSPSAKGIPLRPWEIDAFSRKSMPVARGEFITEIFLQKNVKSYSRIPERPTEDIRQIIRRVLSSNRNIDDAFLVSVAFDPLIDKPSLVIVLGLGRDVVPVDCAPLEAALRNGLSDSAGWNALKVFGLRDVDELREVRRNAHCVYERK